MTDSNEEELQDEYEEDYQLYLWESMASRASCLFRPRTPKKPYYRKEEPVKDVIQIQPETLPSWGLLVIMGVSAYLAGILTARLLRRKRDR